MADNFVNISDYKLWVVEDPPEDLSTLVEDNYKLVTNITTIGTASNNTVRPTTSLGDNGWMRSTQEQTGLTISLTVDHILDPEGAEADRVSVGADTAKNTGQRVLAKAARETGYKGIVYVRYRHPAAANSSPAAGIQTVMRANVRNGSLGLGQGGSGGQFVSATYDLVSFGVVTTAAI